jgi:hypothetical protein
LNKAPAFVDIAAPAAAVLLSLAGWAGFILIFARHMNVYWFILSPIILAVYQFPAVFVFAVWKKKRRRNAEPPAAAEASPADPAEPV